MPLLTKVATREHGEYRDAYTNRKAPAQYRNVYVMERISLEDQEILKEYFLSKRSRQRLQLQASMFVMPFRARRARHTLSVLASYDRSGVCILLPEMWWRDTCNPKHPFRVIQWCMFKHPLNPYKTRDFSGGLLFWLSEHGRAKNKILHETIDDIVIAYLDDVMPRYNDAAQGLLDKETLQSVVDEIKRRADAATMVIVTACVQYSVPDMVSGDVQDLAALGESQAVYISAESQARVWLGKPLEI